MNRRRLPDQIHPDWNSAGRSWRARLCRAILHALGWRLILDIPGVHKAVVIFYPHTSNWDFVIGLLAKFGLGVPVMWAGKDNMFIWPVSKLWAHWGGIPVNRREHTGFVSQLANEFSRREVMMLAIAPEGTRKRTEHWKSGAYRVALAARVPLALAFIDCTKKEIGIGGLLDASGDVSTDFATLRAFYSGKTGWNADQASPIRLNPDSAAH